MAEHTVNVNIVDRSVPIGNHKNIAIINKPNPAMNVDVNARELYLLINNPSYFITDSETGNTINGVNYYDYFPEASPGGGGGSKSVLIEKDITDNGEYIASDDSADGYSSVNVNVPETPPPVLIEKDITDNGEYIASDDSADGYSSVNVNVPETPPPVLIEKSVTQNGTYTAADDEADGYSVVAVNVPNTYAAGDEGKVVQNGSLVSQTSTSVSQNGTINTTTNNSVTVSVPNSYTAQDEGKVVSNGTLVAQTAYPSEITANDTYDTTNHNSITVSVPSASDAYKLTFIPNSSMYRSIVTSELYAINSNSSTSVFGYFDLTPKYRINQESLTFSFDSAFTPSFTSKKLDSFANANANCSASITSEGKYRINISTNGTLYENSTYRFYIQTLFV